jgi:retinol dehydrogenase 12
MRPGVPFGTLGHVLLNAPMELQGKNVVITGANTGIGRVTALELAKRGAKLTLAGRSKEKTEPVLGELAALGKGAASFVALDLASFESTRRAADEIAARGEPIDILINNAGLAGLKGLTKDGFELTFGTNHLGPFVFTARLLPLLLKAKAPRVVNVASRAHEGIKTIDYSKVQMPTATPTGFPEYRLSKLANVLFSLELHNRYNAKGLKSYALHPGVVASDVWREVPWPIRSIMRLFMITNEEGAKTTLHCAMSEGAQSGLYYDKERVKPATKLGQDAAAAMDLWTRSEAWTGEHYPA